MGRHHFRHTATVQTHCDSSNPCNLRDDHKQVDWLNAYTGWFTIEALHSRTTSTVHTKDIMLPPVLKLHHVLHAVTHVKKGFRPLEPLLIVFAPKASLNWTNLWVFRPKSQAWHTKTLKIQPLSYYCTMEGIQAQRNVTVIRADYTDLARYLGLFAA